MQIHPYIIGFWTGIFIAGLVVAIAGTYYLESPLPPITDEQKIADLNELNTRVSFCQAMGYQSTVLVSQDYKDRLRWKELEYTNMGYGKYSGQRYQIATEMPTQIACKKPGEDIIEQYSYEKYKRWMLNIQINNQGD